MTLFGYIKPRFIFYNSLFWLFIIAINFSASYSDSVRSQHAFGGAKTALVLLLAYTPWLLFTPLLYGMINKAVALDRKHHLLKMYLLIFFTWLPMYIAYDGVVMLWNQGVSDKSIFDGMLLYPKFYWFFDAVVYSGIFGGYLAIIYYRYGQKKKLHALTLTNQNTQLELRLSELKMQALQAQLKPHFLFNALNSISSLVQIADKNQALQAISQLSDLLRFAVGASPRKMVALAEELKFSQDYIDLQRLRFSDRLSANLHNHCASDEIQCPPYVVQTLVENAIVHNLERSPDALNIEVNTSCEDNWLHIKVTNCALDNEVDHQGLGVGLSNLRNRLNLLYQDNYRLEVSDDGNIYQVDLSFPVH